MKNKPLREQIASELNRWEREGGLEIPQFDDLPATEAERYDYLDEADQILNLIMKELDGLTLSENNPYFKIEKLTRLAKKEKDGSEISYNKYPEFQVYQDGKEAQLFHTIKELKERLGVEDWQKENYNSENSN